MDAIQPRSILRLSVETRQALCDLPNDIEETGYWLDVNAWVMTVMLLKTGGFLRPIGFIATYICIWMRCRRQHIAT